MKGLDGLARAEFDGLLDLYRVSLTYVTSLVDFGKLRRSMDTQVNEFLRRRRIPTIEVRELSGDTPFGDVRITLDHLEHSGPTDGVIATSMVSHGVDVEPAERHGLQRHAEVDGRVHPGVVSRRSAIPGRRLHDLQPGPRAGPLALPLPREVPRVPRPHGRAGGDQPLEPVRRAQDPAGRADGRHPSGGQPRFLGGGWAPAHLHDLNRMQQALRPADAGGLDSVRPEALLAALGEAYLTDRDEAAELRAELEERVHAAVSSIRSAGAAASAALAAGPATEARVTTSGSSTRR